MNKLAAHACGFLSRFESHWRRFSPVKSLNHIITLRLVHHPVHAVDFTSVKVSLWEIYGLFFTCTLYCGIWIVQAIHFQSQVFLFCDICSVLYILYAYSGHLSYLVYVVLWLGVSSSCGLQLLWRKGGEREGK